MSASLSWTPVRMDGKYLPDELKRVLEKRHTNLWGSGREFDESDVNYLRGLDDGGIKGAKELIEAIEKHGTVRVWLSS